MSCQIVFAGFIGSFRRNRNAHIFEITPGTRILTFHVNMWRHAQSCRRLVHMQVWQKRAHVIMLSDTEICQSRMCRECPVIDLKGNRWLNDPSMHCSTCVTAICPSDNAHVGDVIAIAPALTALLRLSASWRCHYTDTLFSTWAKLPWPGRNTPTCDMDISVSVVMIALLLIHHDPVATHGDIKLCQHCLGLWPVASRYHAITWTSDGLSSGEFCDNQ